MGQSVITFTLVLTENITDVGLSDKTEWEELQSPRRPTICKIILLRFETLVVFVGELPCHKKV